MTRGLISYKIIAIFLGIILSILFSSPVIAVEETSGDIIGPDTSQPTPESFLFTGAANYRIPIEVPAGRLGMTPSLELIYNSYQKNGWLGVGWTLDMGSIQVPRMALIMVKMNLFSQKMALLRN